MLFLVVTFCPANIFKPLLTLNMDNNRLPFAVLMAGGQARFFARRLTDFRQKNRITCYE
jgi:hypothetical protein